MSKNAIHPAVELVVGDVTYALKFDFEAVAEVEDLTGKPLLTGLTRSSIEKPIIPFVRAMLYAALRTEEPDVTFDQAKKLVTRRSLLTVWGKVLDAWVIFQEEPDPAEEGPSESQS